MLEKSYPEYEFVTRNESFHLKSIRISFIIICNGVLANMFFYFFYSILFSCIPVNLPRITFPMETSRRASHKNLDKERDGERERERSKSLYRLHQNITEIVAARWISSTPHLSSKIVRFYYPSPLFLSLSLSILLVHSLRDIARDSNLAHSTSGDSINEALAAQHLAHCEMHRSLAQESADFAYVVDVPNAGNCVIDINYGPRQRERERERWTDRRTHAEIKRRERKREIRLSRPKSFRRSVPTRKKKRGREARCETFFFHISRKEPEMTRASADRSQRVVHTKRTTKTACVFLDNNGAVIATMLLSVADF